MEPIRARFSLLLALLLGSVAIASTATSLALAAPVSATVPAPCTVELTVVPHNQDAEVNSTAPDAVSFVANYTATLPPLAERASLTLTAVVDTGWVATVSPASITITNQRSGTATITVVAPAGARPGDVGTMTVTARMTAAGLQCQDQETGITITPLPYLDAIVGAMAPGEVKLKNGFGSFTLTLGAVSSVPVTVELVYVGPVGATFLAPPTVQLPDPAVSPPNATLTVKIQAPDLAPGAYQLEVRITATTSDGQSAQGALFAPLLVPEGTGEVLSSPLLPLAGAAAAIGAAALWWRRR